MSAAVSDPRDGGEPAPPMRLSAAEVRRRRARSIAIALALGALVALFYIVTIAKLGGNVLQRPL